MRTVIVNAAYGKWYPKGQDRLNRSLDAVGYKGERLFYRDQYPAGCPSHQNAPYAFKPYAMAEAMSRGDLILWVDCSFWAVQPLDTLFEKIYNDGHLMVEAGWSVGQWCTDAALRTLEIDRESAFGMPLYSAGFTGLNMHSQTSCLFLEQWLDKANDGITFRGPWTNKNKEVSSDPRVLGHRHDMTAASVIACKLGMRYAKGGYYFAYAGKDDSYDKSKNIYFLARGM